MAASDWDDVRRIYAEGIATGNATMETAAPPWESWDTAHRPDCRLVARDGALLLGWAALSRVSERCAYGGVAEVSVYVSQDARGRGVGRRLLEELVRASEQAGIWTLQAGIFPARELFTKLGSLGILGLEYDPAFGGQGAFRGRHERIDHSGCRFLGECGNGSEARGERDGGSEGFHGSDSGVTKSKARNSVPRR